MQLIKTDTHKLKDKKNKKKIEKAQSPNPLKKYIL